MADVSATTANQSISRSAAADVMQINTLNRRYPGTVSLYPVPSAMLAADTPQPVRFTTVDRILVKTASERQVGPAVHQNNNLLRERIESIRARKTTSAFET